MPFEKTARPDYCPFSREHFDAAIKNGETTLDFAARMNTFVNRHTVHYFFDNNTLGNIDVMSTPLSWSWPLWLCGLWGAISGNKFSVEFCDSVRGLERGYGYCSQRALILLDILRRNHLYARIVDLEGHVVCLLNDSQKEVVLDPDFGVVIPHTLEYIRNNPDILRMYMDESSIGLVRSIYEEGRWIGRKSGEYHCFSNFDIAAITAAAWLVPLVLLAFGCLGTSSERRKIRL